jgi:hypothetical protein
MAASEAGVLMLPNVAPQARLVVLGASNVARGVADWVRIAREMQAGPLEIVTAMGHGRAVGVSTWAPFRRLPSILECGLWDCLAKQASLPTSVLITDLGNDLVFGQTPQHLMVNVQECVRRLRPVAQRIMLTTLPLASLQRLSRWKFQLFRRLLFPKATLSFVQAQEYAAELQELIEKLCLAEGLALCRAEDDWYGFDPIHIRFGRQHEAWMHILNALLEKKLHISKNFFRARSEWKSLRSLLPERSIVSRGLRVVAQPSALLTDGTRISFY